MPRLHLYIFIAVFSFLNFSGSHERVNTGSFSHYGGVFHMNITEDFRSLFPLSIVESPGQHIASQIYEGLVKNDPATLQVIPCLAQKWEVNSTGDEYTFHLRTNVFFQDDACFENGKGRKLVANDVKFCFQKIIHESPNNYYSFIFAGIIENDDAFKVIDDSTISIHTTHTCSYLTSLLTLPACWIYPHEAYDKYGDDMRVKCVGTGPFAVKAIVEGDFVVLQKNPEYWRTDEEGNKLPYLDAIKFTFIKEKRAEQISFLTSELDMLADPEPAQLPELIANQDKSSGVAFNLLVSPALSFNYYGFLTTQKPFNDIKVRQAFNYAIDKERIANFLLQGDVQPIVNGFVPPGIPGYTNTDVNYKFDVEKARKLLSEAGYPNGKNFPVVTLQTNSGGSRNVTVSDEIQAMLKENLNIEIKINVLPFVQHLENFETSKAQFWRSGWIADMADPREFLELAYGKNVPDNADDRSSPNSMRFKNAEFDAAFDKASNETDFATRMNDYKEAETIAMKNAFILPLYYETNTQLLNKHVRGYNINALDIRDFSVVYFVQ